MRELLHEMHPLLEALAYCHLVFDLTCALPAEVEELGTCPFAGLPNAQLGGWIPSEQDRVHRWDEPPSVNQALATTNIRRHCPKNSPMSSIGWDILPGFVGG